MQREMKEQRFLLERMLKFFGLCGVTVLVSLGAMIGILIVVWGNKLQVSQYVSCCVATCELLCRNT
jgi:hypothetical protein